MISRSTATDWTRASSSPAGCRPIWIKRRSSLSSGEATVETMDGEATVGEAALIRFATGEFQSGKNDSDGQVVTFAMSAPRDSEDGRV